MSDKIFCEIEINDSTLKKHIERGWITGMSVGSDGSRSFVTCYPMWYRAWVFIQRCAKRIWDRLRGRKPIHDFELDKETGTITFGEAIPKGATIIAQYTYREREV